MDKLESYKFTILDLGAEPVKKEYPVQEYEIWLAPYHEGQGGGYVNTATFEGKCKGRDFKDACIRFYSQKLVDDRKKADEKGDYIAIDYVYYSPDRNTYWGISIHPSKESAEGR